MQKDNNKERSSFVVVVFVYLYLLLILYKDQLKGDI